MRRAVVIVFDPDFREQLRATAFKHPVWMIETPANRSAAEEVWGEQEEWPHLSVTMFRDVSPGGKKEEWEKLLEQIELHHGRAATRPAFETVDVVGAQLHAPARAALWDLGFRIFEDTARGFRARRPAVTPSRSSSSEADRS